MYHCKRVRSHKRTHTQKKKKKTTSLIMKLFYVIS